MMKGFFERISRRRREMAQRGVLAELENCLYCGMDLTSDELFERYRICPGCQFHYLIPAYERIELLADSGSFIEINRSLASLDPLSFSGDSSYKKRVFDAQKRTGLSEAVVTGVCQIEGTLTVLVVLDFGFLGGGMGCVVGEKVTLAFEHALRKRLPLVALVSSGGARVQEGVLSLMQMAKTSAAAKQFYAAGLPFISLLANPTTGAVYSSFANLADIIIAEPHALIGFAPLKLVMETEGRELPPDSHTAESHLRHGMIDCIVERTRQRDLLAILLDMLSSKYRLTLRRRFGPYPPIVPERESAWQSVQLARHAERPTSLDYIGRITTSFIELHGDRCYGDDESVVCGLGDIGGEAVVIIAQERGHGEQGKSGRLYPEGFRKAQRAMSLAAKFMLPVITLIDTPGAYPGLEAEERGIGSAIAQCLAQMSDLPTPIIAAIIGEGGSEAALAFGVADRTLMMENAIFSVMPPERAAVLLYRDASRADEVAPALRLTSEDCRKLGVVDVLVPEPRGGAHVAPDEAARQLKKFILNELVQVQGISAARLVRARSNKFRAMGRYSSRISVAISKEGAQLQEFLSQRLEELKEYLPSKAEEVPLEEEKEPLLGDG
jgi:acetyl-CoA carboxylase carboxyl transferase alpha subunit/acetyl-CoA carboxylase carboxyl transferase beta subunit